VFFKIIMTTSVTRTCFTPDLQDRDQERFFLVSDRSCPKTDGLRPHHWPWPWKPDYGSVKVVGNVTIRYSAYSTFLLTNQSINQSII